ncbi:MAG TPA: 3-hydroxyacyl-CoA dehydrogenase family protein [Thermodesulfobacteriota bacterium]|nr:3-hydroxyacyl-CoA dehydrogenase family protein [Thermodesulfobacteriota bacterium]
MERSEKTTMRIDWIERVLVVGAGTMGHSIAMVFAQGGFEVDLVDVKEEVLDRAMNLIRSNLNTLKEGGLIRSKAIPKIINRIHPSTSLNVGERADFVVEAISEDQRAKRELFHVLDRICPEKTIISSNTSYLNIFRFAKTSRPEKMLIAHWYVPPHLIPLVDVVKGPRTSMETVATVETLLLKLGKEPVVMKKFIPGYVVNRLQRAMAREIFYLLDKGYASPEGIDRAVKNSLGIRIPVVGIVQRYDFAGLDLALTFEQNPSIHLVSKDRSPKTLMDLVKRGHLGVKSGKGFYDYSSRKMSDVLKERDMKMIKLLKFLELK